MKLVENTVDIIKKVTKSDKAFIENNTVKVTLSDEILYDREKHEEMINALIDLGATRIKEYEDHTNGNIYLTFFL